MAMKNGEHAVVTVDIEYLRGGDGASRCFPQIPCFIMKLSSSILSKVIFQIALLFVSVNYQSDQINLLKFRFPDTQSAFNFHSSEFWTEITILEN